MRMKVSNYIAGQLVAHGISQVFTVTGGGAMHLNDALGHQEGLHCLYQHHEQACAMAAESYARIHNKIGLLCVTTGPGGTNAITGVVGGWLDSIPMLILSGQVRYDTTARWSGTGIRAMGDQEFDICKAIDCMTKYSEMVIDPMRIRYCMEKALYLADSGRKGPSWLDIPLNVQGAYVETDELIGFDPVDYENGGNGWAEKKNVPAIPEDEAGEGEKRQVLPKKVTEEIAKAIIEKMMKHYENPSIGVKIIELDDAYQMCTKSEMYEYLIKIARQPKRHALTDVLLETLSIIAYKQPITKVEIEKIRGVSCDHAVNKLVEYNLVCELGRLDAPGRPLLFGTTEEFLRSFGVQSIDELPVLNPVQVEEFKQEAEAEMHMKLDI